jgi:uncharacterized protein YndB with AHSA1/START domain
VPAAARKGNRNVTGQKSLKRRVRTRMSRTGERYTAARRQVLTKAPAETNPTPPAPSAEPPAPSAEPPAAATPFRGERTSSDEAIAARTGRPWGEWFGILQAWGAADRPHRDIARWLSTEHHVDGWWAQELTVGFEMAIGRRRPGERPDGFAITSSRTVTAPVERLFAAFVDEDLRARWLPGVSLRLRTATPYRSARFDWEGGSSRLAIGFTAKGDARSTVALAHERLPDRDAATGQKTFWRERLGDLQQLLER